MEVCELTDMTRGRFQELQNEVVTAVTSITPASEYITFTETNR